MNVVLYDRLAALLRYPDAAYLSDLDACCCALAAADPQAAQHLARFGAALRTRTLTDLEELFTHTFDINPACALEVGWQLFGEEYERGTFLVRMRQEMRRLGLSETAELPDHLTHVLAVLGRMEPERADDFATACVLPAVDRMYASIAGDEVPYEHVLGAIRVFLTQRHTGARHSADSGAQAME